MTSQNLRLVGIACFILCAICLFVAYERYHANASNVAAVNELSRGLPGSPLGEGIMKPATPAATKYALFFALLTGIGGVVSFAKAGADRRGDGQ